MAISTVESMVFIEGEYADAKVIGEITTSLGRRVDHTGLKDIKAVKAWLARQARSIGANAVIDFSFWQKTDGTLRMAFGTGNTYWYGRGKAVRLPDEAYERLRQVKG